MGSESQASIGTGGRDTGRLLPGRAEIVVVGTSIMSSSLASVEPLMRAIDSAGGAFAASMPGALEHATLKTCNRVEFYLVTNSPDLTIQALQEKISAVRGIGGNPPALFSYRGVRAIRHLFEVTAGLDSVVAGEPQILSQARRAGIQARREGAAKGVLSPMFDRASRVGLRVREKHGLDAGSGSLSTLAVDLVAREAKKDADVLLVGTGKMIQIAAQSIGGERRVYVVSKRKKAPRWLGDSALVTYSDVPRLAKKCGVVISATTSSVPLIRKKDLAGGVSKVVVDLGMPRNVSPEVRELPHVRLYDLGDLASMARSAKRPRGIESAIESTRREATEFNSWLIQTRLTSTLSEIHSLAGRVRDEEVKRALRKLGSDPREQRVVEAMARRIVSRIMARPTGFARSRSVDLSEEEKLELLGSVFGLGAGEDDG